MRKTINKWTAAASILVIQSCFVPPAAAGYYDGNELLNACEPGSSETGRGITEGLCMGYIAGVVDDFAALRLVQKKTSCIPRNVTVGQLKDVVVKYLKENPEKRNWWGASLVRGAVLDAWAECKLP